MRLFFLKNLKLPDIFKISLYFFLLAGKMPMASSYYSYIHHHRFCPRFSAALQKRVSAEASTEAKAGLTE